MIKTRNRIWLILLLIFLCLTITSQIVSAYTYPKSIREREEEKGFNIDSLISSLPITLPLIFLLMIPTIVFAIRFKTSHDAVKNRLNPGERLLFRDRFLYATNKRLIRCLSSSNFKAVEYNKITSIDHKRISIGRVIASIVVVFLGILMIIFGIIAYIGPEYSDGNTLYRFGGELYISIIFWIFGPMSILMAFSIISSYIQIESPKISKQDRKKWRFHIRGKKAEQLINMINKEQQNPLKP